MEHRKLGSTGLRVSSVGLGTMTWGRDTDELEARDQLDVFLDAGGTLVDTAASYCEGSAEEVVGALMTDHVDRRELVLVSKAGVRTWRTGARATTPLEETADALRAAVVSGRTRYVGVSNHPAWASVRAADLLSCAGPGLAAVEVEYSLVCRGIERELVPAADALGFGVLGYAPLGRGVLTGRYRATTPPDSRGASPHLRSYVAPYLGEPYVGVVEAVATAATGLDRKPVEVALAWARDAPGVTAAIVGARTPSQLRGALSSDDLVLPAQIRHALDEITAIRTGYPERF